MHVRARDPERCGVSTRGKREREGEREREIERKRERVDGLFQLAITFPSEYSRKEKENERERERAYNLYPCCYYFALGRAGSARNHLPSNFSRFLSIWFTFVLNSLRHRRSFFHLFSFRVAITSPLQLMRGRADSARQHHCRYVALAWLGLGLAWLFSSWKC